MDHYSGETQEDTGKSNYEPYPLAAMPVARPTNHSFSCLSPHVVESWTTSMLRELIVQGVIKGTAYTIEPIDNTYPLRGDTNRGDEGKAAPNAKHDT